MDDTKIESPKQRWYLHLIKALRQEPILLIIFFMLPFFSISVLILNQRVSAQTAMISEVRQDIARHKAESQHLLAAGTEAMDERISNLEKSIYVDIQDKLEQKRQPRSTAEVWQRQRDNEFKDRILALERWRLQQQGRD